MNAFAERRDLLGALDGATVASRFQAVAAELADSPALSWDTVTVSWAEYRRGALALAAGFMSLGLSPGDPVALMLSNRAEHLFADQGAMHAGGVALTLYPTLSAEQVAYVISDAGARIAVLEGAEQVERFGLALPGSLQHIIVLDETAIPAGDSRFISWASFVSASVRAWVADPSAVDRRWQALHPDDVVTLLYTSGTTGPPKGVRLTHENVLYEAEAIKRLGGFSAGPVNVSYLPLAHIAEREISIYLPIHLGGQVWLCPDPTQLATALRTARPTSFFAVPRVWEKLQSGLAGFLAAEESEERRNGVSAAMAIGKAYIEAGQAGGLPTPELQAQFDFVDERVLALLRGAIGLDRCEWFSSGAAPLAPSVSDFFAGLGIVMSDVYGMTETTGAITANHREAYRIGSVGRALPGVEIEIAEDGEVLTRGPLSTPGYLNQPVLTGELLVDGWLHTGDIGTLSDDGYLTIVDRKKELLITSGGENVAPALVEGVLKESPLIGQAMAVGEARRYVAALLVLDGEALPGWLAAQGLPGLTVSEAAVHPAVLGAVEDAVELANERLARVQQVKTWKLLTQEWTPESGELTPTFKLRRRIILDRYAEEIEELYR